MSRCKQGVIVACALTVLSLPGTAAAQDESELDQYVPNVPGAGADEPLRDIRDVVIDEAAGRTEAQDGGLPPETLDELRSMGTAGEPAAAVAAAAAAAAANGSDGSASQGANPVRLGAAAGTEGEPFLGGLLGALAGNGFVLPLALVAILAAGAWYAVRRRAIRGQR